MLDIINKIINSLNKLENYLDTSNLKGYDPYDALNSKILSRFSFNKRIVRIFYTQALKIMPINLRPLLGIRKDYNPKGLGLFLAAYSKLYSIYRTNKYFQKINDIASFLEEVKCKGYSGYCWGYNFDWQGEIDLLEKGTPTIVNTAFIAHAFLDVYELFGEEKFFNIARSSCNFILYDLFILKCNDSICFSYSPISRTKIHNANVLGAGLLARVYSYSKENKLLEYATKAINYTINKQREDGAWYYGENERDDGFWYKGVYGIENQVDSKYSGFVKYIDSYHTAFILESLLNYTKYIRDKKYMENIKRGFEFYEKHFFLEDGTPKYYFNNVYPIDIHTAAQAIITFVRLHKIKESNRILQKVALWMIDHMQDKRNYFYFRKGRFFYNKIPYIRWSQAWAFHALTTYYFYLHTHFN